MLFISDLHQIRATLYPSSRSSMCTKCCYRYKIKYKKQMTRGLPWVKISKVMPLPKSIPPGKGGKPYGKKSKSFV